MTAPLTPAASPARRPGTALLAVALATTTALTLAPAGAAAAPASAPLERVVVTGVGGVAAAADAVVAAGGQVLEWLPLFDGVSARLPAGTSLAPGLVVAPDRPIELSSMDSASTAGTGVAVREALGLGLPAGEGRGVTVAVVDTGVADHPDLDGRVTRVDLSGDGAGDGYGHGTFVAGLVAGDGSSSGGTYAGIAPGAQVLDVRVGDDDGDTDLSTVLRGLHVAATRGADVVNLSLSAGAAIPPQLDPLALAVERLWSRGVTVVIAAGNAGPEAGSVTSPGVTPSALTVGAVGPHGLSDYTGRGPVAFVPGAVKPELATVGTSVVSTLAAGSSLAATATSTLPGGAYLRGTGTSFSTAVASGAAAVVLAERKRYTPDQVKRVLTSGDVVDAAVGTRALSLPAALAADPGPKRTSADRGADPVPGSDRHWGQFVRDVLGDDPAAAASSWSALPPPAKRWAASSWSELPADVRAWAASSWSGRMWAGRMWADHASAEEWAMRDWAGRMWAGRMWAASSWSGRMWAGRMWADDEWVGRMWAEDDWAGRMWAGRMWAGRMWADDEWAGRMWAGRMWAGRMWAGRMWAGGFA